jgi:hypothetical protein
MLGRLAELNALYSSSNISGVIKSRRMSWPGHVARMGERRGEYRILVGRHEERTPLGRPRCRWEDDIKLDLLEVGWEGMDWIDLEGEVAGCCGCGNEPSGSIKLGEFLD